MTVVDHVACSLSLKRQKGKMLKRITKKLGGAKHKEKCTITVNIKRLDSLPEALKQVKVVWEKDGLVKAESSSCTVHKGTW